MANIPSPVVGAGGGGQRGLGESIILALASAAPGMLMQFLGQRQQSADINAQGEASTQILAEMARNGTLSPELFQSAGGTVTPGRTVQGVTAPSGLQTPTLTGSTGYNAGAVNRRVAPQLLQQLMSTQQAQAGIEASKASVATSRVQSSNAIAENARQQELQPFRVKQIESSLLTDKFARESDRRRLALAEKSEIRQAGNEAERIGIERERLGLARREAVQDVTSRLSALHSDQFARFTNLAQLYASSGSDARTAKINASVDVWGKTQPLKLEEFLAANVERATTAILTGQDVEPDEAILKAVLGDRPDVTYAQGIGLLPTNVDLINTQLRLHDNDAGKVLEIASKTLPLEGDALADELAKFVDYLTYKTGNPIALPIKERGSILAALRRLNSIRREMMQQPDAALQFGTP